MPPEVILFVNACNELGIESSIVLRSEAACCDVLNVLSSTWPDGPMCCMTAW